MERFDKQSTFIYGASHKLAPAAYDVKDETKASFNLNQTDSYRVEYPAGQYWLGMFQGWHGAHALFYIPKRHNVAAVWFKELRQIVKRVKQ